MKLVVEENSEEQHTEKEVEFVRTFLQHNKHEKDEKDVCNYI
jgi:hypothetical protein